MVLKETSGKNAGNVSNPVLSGKVPDEGGTYNRFSCFAVHSKCCDMDQNDTIGKIELNPSFVLSSDNTNYKNDIQ